MYRISNLAIVDLENIFLESLKYYTEDQEIALNYQKYLIAGMQWIGDNPNAGTVLLKRKGYYKWSVGSHVIVFTKTKQSISIERVLNQKEELFQILRN